MLNLAPRAMKIFRQYLCILLLIQVSTVSAVFAQETTVHDIRINGNIRTRSSIVLRELSFRSGESFPADEFNARVKDAEHQLINTSLFHSVSIHTIPYDSNSVDVVVELIERWYLFPIPFFKPIDRNLNQWLVEHNGDLSRVNYGVKLMYNNVTGVNDKIRINLITGYTRQVSFSYNRLYIDRKLRWGINTDFATGKAREVNYNTIDDKQLFWRDTRFVRSFTSANLSFTYRKAIRSRHSFGVSFSSERVSDTIITLNAEYFKGGRQIMGYPTFYYTFDYLNLDYNAYPTSGYAAKFNFSKSGLNRIVNLWQLHLKGVAYYPISPRSFIQTSVYGGLKLPFRQPWFAQRFLGYGDIFMHGYEYYVVDGAAGGYFKTVYARQFLNHSFRGPRTNKKLAGDRIPLRIYGKVFGNAGYVYDPEPGANYLSNKALLSAGIGLDIITAYDMVIKLEWSFNQLGQNGLFLHSKSVF
jgi:outer membrane protein assembly factor BamA